ncbi:MAG TPA: sortase [Anaerolineales bacterium]|nr:sortase [Anaerolineales bacterium]
MHTFFHLTRKTKPYFYFIVSALVLTAVLLGPVQGVKAANFCVDPSGAGGCYTTIQAAIDAASAGDTINVAAGTYVEDLAIDKALILLGPNSSVNPNTGARVSEAIIHPATSNPDPAVCTVMAYISVNDVTIKGFTFDGDNPNLTSGVPIGSADVDACEILAGYEGMGNITVENNILRHSTYSAIDFYNYIVADATSNNYIRYNLIENIGETTYNWGIGVLIYNNFYADVTNNVLQNVRVGIQTGNFYQANTGATGSISNNTINSWRLGIFHNLWYQNASVIPVSNNTINAISSADSTKFNGILLSSWQGSADTTLQNNTINIGTISQAESAGYNIWNTPTTAALTISGGSVTGGEYGVFVNNFEGYSSNARDTSILIDGIQVKNAAAAGVYVKDSSSNTNGATVDATLQNMEIINSNTGVLVSGSDASANIDINTIAGNTIGVSVELASTAALSCNSIYNNSTFGVSNTTLSLINAENNWWGDASGPYHATTNPTGTGDTVSDNVDFDPWNATTGCAPAASTIPTAIDSIPADGAKLYTSISSLVVEFNKEVLSDASAKAANNTSNYMLFEAGGNKTFDTQSCAGGIISDDVAIAVNSVSYNNNSGAGPYTAALTTASLGDGSYKLFVCGSTSIYDLFGNVLNDGSDSTFTFQINSAASGSASSLPATGFRHGEVTELPKQPAATAYADSTMILEIPTLGVSMPVVGVPQSNSSWDVTWLGNSAGYLYGSAFPTWEGNTVLTGHVWDANNQPGPFSELNTLQYGDRVQIQAWGLTYTYEVRESNLVTTKDLDGVFQSEDYDWVTLVTCEIYNPVEGNYFFRRVVRAVLISVQ